MRRVYAYVPVVVGASLMIVACGGSGGDVRQTGSVEGAAPAAACATSEVGQAAERAIAKCLTQDDGGAFQPTPSRAAQVTVFIDRSASMQGFLDPAYPTHVPTDYRSVIDKVLVGVHPTSAFSFGSEIRPVTATLGTLADRGFYSDHDTRTEDVISRIAADTDAKRAYVIVTDGRRGSPNAALAQYVGMRDLAAKWVEKGGTLIVATSMAPFATVASDPSGCRRADENAADQRCPLYAFAFAPNGSERWLAGVLSAAFEHIYSWPALRIGGQEEELASPADQKSLQFEFTWPPTPLGSPVVRARGKVASNSWLPLKWSVAETKSPEGAAILAALRGQRANVVIAARRFGVGPIDSWAKLDASAADIRQSSTDPDAVEFITHGQAGRLTLYRIDLMPEGSPSWLDAFDATSGADRLRTFGLGRLFEGFRQNAKSLSPESASILRFYVVAN